MTGMGGGSLMTPMLVIVFGFKPTFAIGTDILHGAIFKSFGAVRHRRLGTVHAQLRSGCSSARRRCRSLGVELATWLKHRYGDGVADGRGADASAGRSSFGAARPRRQDASSSTACSPTTRRSARRRDQSSRSRIGAVGGFVVGLTSVGSGTFFGLIMLLVFPLTAREDRRHGHLPRGGAALGRRAGHLVAGNVDLHATAWLLLGSIPGVLISSQLHAALPDRVLRLGLALVLLLSGPSC